MMAKIRTCEEKSKFKLRFFIERLSGKKTLTKRFNLVSGYGGCQVPGSMAGCKDSLRTILTSIRSLFN